MLSRRLRLFNSKPTRQIKRKFVEQSIEENETDTYFIGCCCCLSAMQLFSIIKNKNFKNGYYQ